MNNFMNMPFGGNFNMGPLVYDPAKTDSRVKKTLISQNISQSKIGLYKMYPKFRPVTCKFTSKYNPGVASSICETSVVYEHSIDVAENYAELGMNFTNKNKMNPVILNVVGKDFTGTNFESNDEIRDQMVNLRTSFNNTVGTSSPFPVGETECVYAQSVTTIRPKNPTMGFLAYPQTFRFAMITTSPIKCPKMLDDERMCSTDFVRTCSIIECVFQTAIAGFHPVLILTPFGHEEDENPIDDIIKIYNYCIFKYGHRFSKIIVAIPPFYPKEMFDKYNKEIVRLQDLTAIIDSKYDQLEMQKNLEKTGKKVIEPEVKVSKKTKTDQSSLSNGSSNSSGVAPDMQNMMAMMQANPMMMMMMQNMMAQQMKNQ